MILQKSPKEMVTNIERKPLRISNWRYILFQNEPPLTEIDVCLSTATYKIFNISPIDFLTLSNNPSKNVYKTFRFERSVLICDVCAGGGTVDWITNITTKKETSYLGPKKFIRDPKGKIHIFSSLVEKEYTVYVSSPKIKKGENICRKCQGSGLIVSKHAIYKKSVEPKELERNIIYSYK